MYIVIYYFAYLILNIVMTYFNTKEYSRTALNGLMLHVEEVPSRHDCDVYVPLANFFATALFPPSFQ